MDIPEAIDARHSVRRYDGIPISDADAEALLCEIAECNRESGLNIQLVRGEEKLSAGGWRITANSRASGTTSC